MSGWIDRWRRWRAQSARTRVIDDLTHQARCAAWIEAGLHAPDLP